MRIHKLKLSAVVVSLFIPNTIVCLHCHFACHIRHTRNKFYRLPLARWRFVVVAPAENVGEAPGAIMTDFNVTSDDELGDAKPPVVGEPKAKLGYNK